MRTTKAISITLPTRMLEDAKKLAGKEHRTISELMREALRRYQREREWDEINALGRAKAAKLGVNNEDDVVRLIHSFREDQRTRKKPA